MLMQSRENYINKHNGPNGFYIQVLKGLPHQMLLVESTHRHPLEYDSVIRISNIL